MSRACKQEIACISECRYRPVLAQTQLESKVQSRKAALGRHISGRRRLPWSKQSGHCRIYRLVPRIRNQCWTDVLFGRPAVGLSTFFSSTPSNKTCSHRVFSVCRRCIAAVAHRWCSGSFSPRIKDSRCIERFAWATSGLK
jgi:hypothetical protein